jgi:hypothetical protein
LKRRTLFKHLLKNPRRLPICRICRPGYSDIECILYHLLSPEICGFDKPEEKPNVETPGPAPTLYILNLSEQFLTTTVDVIRGFANDAETRIILHPVFKMGRQSKCCLVASSLVSVRTSLLAIYSCITSQSDLFFLVNKDTKSLLNFSSWRRAVQIQRQHAMTKVRMGHPNDNSFNAYPSGNGYNSYSNGNGAGDSHANGHSSHWDYGRNPLAHANTGDSARLPPFAGHLQPGLHKPPKKDGIANPAPLSLIRFALTTFVLSLINFRTRDVTEPNLVLAPASCVRWLDPIACWHVVSLLYVRSH